MYYHVEEPSLSLCYSFTCMPNPYVTVEDVLLAVGEQTGYENLSTASRMNKAVVVLLKEKRLVNWLVETGVTINVVFLQITLLFSPPTWLTISNVPLFIIDGDLMRELALNRTFAQ